MEERTAEAIREHLQDVTSISVSLAVIMNNPGEVKKRIKDARRSLDEAEKLL